MLTLVSLEVSACLEIAADSHPPTAESLTFYLRLLVRSRTDLKMPFDSTTIIFIFAQIIKFCEKKSSLINNALVLAWKMCASIFILFSGCGQNLSGLWPDCI